MSTPNGILRVIVKRGNEKRYLDLPAGTSSLDDIVALIAKSLEPTPEPAAEKPKAEKPAKSKGAPAPE